LLLDGYEEDIDEWLSIKEGTRVEAEVEVDAGDEE